MFQLCSKVHGTWMFQSFGMWCHAVGWAVPDVPMDHYASIFRFMQSKKYQKTGKLQSFEVSGATHPTTHCHIPEDLRLWQHWCENVTFRMSLVCQVRHVLSSRFMSCYWVTVLDLWFHLTLSVTVLDLWLRLTLSVTVLDLWFRLTLSVRVFDLWFRLTLSVTVLDLWFLLTLSVTVVELW